jgi:Rad3-related DNA helicase
LIRSSEDTGVIALFDKRFLDRPYRRHLPADWLDPDDDDPGRLAGDPAAAARAFFATLDPRRRA